MNATGRNCMPYEEKLLLKQEAAEEMYEALKAISVRQIYGEVYITIDGGSKGFWSSACPREMVAFAMAWEDARTFALAKAEGRS